MKKEIFQELKKELPEVRTNISLKNYTTFKIGGSARYFFAAQSKEDLVKAVRAAKKFKTPFFILGGGSNVLVSDKGYGGLIIMNRTLNIPGVPPAVKILNSKITAEAGILLGQLVNVAANGGLEGLEWASGIPGTVGGAIYGNAGTKKEFIGDIIKSVEVFDAKPGKVKKLSGKECKFGYRDSIFKHKKHLIILSCQIQLKKGKSEDVKEKVGKFILNRRKTQPLNLPSAGSIFKNPAPDASRRRGADPEPELSVRYGAGPKGFFAGELIEKCGLKGKKFGRAQISQIHANFIVNLGDARSKDVKGLIDLVKIKVKEEFGAKLEEEIQYLGF